MHTRACARTHPPTHMHTQVLVAVATKGVMWDGMLTTFCGGIKAAGIQNHVIFALDKETKDWCVAWALI